MIIRDFNNRANKRDYRDTGKRGRSKRDFRSPIITERFLSLFLKVASSQYVNKRSEIINLQKFIDGIPKEKYEKDTNVYALILSIGSILKNKFEGILDKEELIELINIDLLETFDEEKDNTIFPTILSGDEASEKEKDLIRRTVDTYLRYEAVLSQKDELSDVLTDIGSGNVRNIEESLEALKLIINELYDEFKKTEYSTDRYIITHTSDIEDFREKLKNAYDYATSPKIALKTGIKMLNDMLSVQGAFLSSKFYMFYADTNTFKSALLKYIAKWIQKYNNEMFREEYLATGKRPTVLYISLEDGEIEDINRMFTTTTAQDLMSYNSFGEAEKAWNNSFNPTETIIDICQINSTENSINLNTIEGFIKNLEENGYFVIALIIDSFDLMAPSEEDIYRGITDETALLTNRAKAIQKYVGDKLFPVITAHQLNRVGNQTITEKKEKGVVDIAKTLGRSFISGAYDIERRVHWSAFIYVERSKYDNEIYLEIKRDKMKYKRTDTDYLVHLLKNGFIIEDDFGTDKVLSRGSILPVDNDNMYSQGANGLGSRGVSTISKMNRELGIDTKDKKEEDKKEVLFSSVSHNNTSITTPPPFIMSNISDESYYSYSTPVTPFNYDEQKPDVWVLPF
jgi:hypothetical protein